MLDIEAVGKENAAWEKVLGAVFPDNLLLVKAWGEALVALREAEWRGKQFAAAVNQGAPWKKIGDVVTAEEQVSAEDELRRALGLPGVLKAADDAMRRAVHVLMEQERQINRLREERDAARAAQVRVGTVTPVLKLEDAEELRLFFKDSDMLETPVNDDLSPAWKRIDAALNTALGPARTSGAAKTALFLKTLDGWNGEARLYRCDPPFAGTHHHVVVSAVNAMLTGPETYIFAGDEHGGVVNYTELDGSFRGALDHGQALANAGYAVRLRVVVDP